MEVESASKKRSRDELEDESKAHSSEPPLKKQKTDIMNGGPDKAKESTPPLVMV